MENLVGVPGLIRPEQRFPKCVLCVCVCVCARAQAGDIVGVDHRRPLSVEALGKSTGASEPTIGRRQDELPNAGNWFLHLADIEGRYPL